MLGKLGTLALGVENSEGGSSIAPKPGPGSSAIRGGAGAAGRAPPGGAAGCRAVCAWLIAFGSLPNERSGAAPPAFVSPDGNHSNGVGTARSGNDASDGSSSFACVGAAPFGVGRAAIGIGIGCVVGAPLVACVKGRDPWAGSLAPGPAGWCTGGRAWASVCCVLVSGADPAGLGGGWDPAADAKPNAGGALANAGFSIAGSSSPGCRSGGPGLRAARGCSGAGRPR